MKQTPTVIEKAYWRDPVHVLTGLLWLMIGFTIGVLVMA